MKFCVDCKFHNYVSGNHLCLAVAITQAARRDLVTGETVPERSRVSYCSSQRMGAGCGENAVWFRPKDAEEI